MSRKDYYYNKFKSHASQYLNDKFRLKHLLEKVKIKVEKGGSEFSAIVDNIRVFYRLVLAYSDGSYRGIPVDKVLLIIAAFIYLVSPIDAVFDFLPGGLIDDAAIFYWLINSLKNELEEFREWEEKKSGAY